MAQPAGVIKPAVLVVDDEEMLRAMLARVLRQAGFDVRLAEDGPHAVAMYQLHHDEIAVVLLDVMLPGLDGPATLTALQEINPVVCCCFMSGYTGPYTLEVLLWCGAKAL